MPSSAPFAVREGYSRAVDIRCDGCDHGGETYSTGDCTKAARAVAAARRHAKTTGHAVLVHDSITRHYRPEPA